MIDKTVKSYRILEQLGDGATGWAYRAEDTRDGRHVTLKFLPFELKEDPEALQRFMDEAQAASNLDHPNIGKIFEISESEDGRMFLARAYYDGESLDKRIARGPLPVDEAVAIARQLANGLTEAHRHSIIHRDLIPANILVTQTGGVKILDFGLAKMVSGGGLTQVGWSLGTPEYMSPEQIRGNDSEPTTDLWTLGVVFYEMLTAKQPFAGSNLAQVLTSIQTLEPPPISESRDDDPPPGLDRILARLLAKKADQRYAKCPELIRDLESWEAGGAEGSGIVDPPARVKPMGVGSTEPASDATPQETIKALWVAALISLGALGLMAYLYLG